MKKSGTKRALTLSVLSIVLCLAMLVGTTFAWFTDSVSTGVNRIVAGNLDVKLSYRNAAATAFSEVKTATDDLFVTAEGEAILWEPGVCAVTYLKLENAGSLALKYRLSVNAEDRVKGADGAALSDVLKTAVVEIGEADVGTYDRATAAAAAEAVDAESVLDYEKSGSMAAGADPLYFAMIVYFPAEIGNTYNGKVYNRSDVKLETDLGINLVATQDTVESDSFDEQYDAAAVYPAVPTLIDTTANFLIMKDSERSATTGGVTISVPASAVEKDTQAVFSMKLTDSTPDSVTYEISLKDEAGNDITLADAATVTVNIGTDLKNVQVYHSEVPMEADAYSYNRYTGELNITTVSFSPFKITYEFDPLATLNGVAYPTAYHAIFAAEDGDTVIVQESYQSSGLVLNLTEPKAVTIDLNGHTLISNNSARAIQVAYTGAELTVRNGKIQSTGSTTPGAAVFNGAKLTMEDVEISSDYYCVYATGASTIEMKNVDMTAGNDGVRAFRGSQVTMKGVNLTAGNDGAYVSESTLTVEDVNLTATEIGIFGYGANNTITVNGSKIQSHYFGVYQNGSCAPAAITIQNSEIVDTAGTGIYISNSASTGDMQTLTVENCSITGPTAVEMKYTNATITNSILTGTETPTGSGANDNGTCTKGYALALTTNGADDYVTGTVTVTGCKFYNGETTEGESNGYIFVYQVREGAFVTIDGISVSDFNTYGGETNP